MTQSAMPARFRLDVSIAAGNAREFDLLRDGLSPLYAMDAADRQARSSFGAAMTSYQFADVAISSGAASAARFERTTQTIARSGIDSICLHLYSHGGCDLDVEGRALELKPGDLCFLDMTRRSTVRAPDYGSLTIMLPRSLLAPFVADPDNLHGQVLPTSAPLNALLTGHLRTVLAQAPVLDVPDVLAASRALAAMVAAFAGASAEGSEAIVRTAAVVSLQSARRIVEANLHDPELGPDFLCRRLGVSRARLYRLFEPTGGVSYYIQQRRMRRAYQDIVDPAFAHERVGEIAARYGFSSISVFSRAFRYAHGASPSELRGDFGRNAVPDFGPGFSGDSAFETMSRWLLGAETLRR